MSITEEQKKNLKREILLDIVDALKKGAAGPCDYWFKQLAERLLEKISISND